MNNIKKGTPARTLSKKKRGWSIALTVFLSGCLLLTAGCGILLTLATKDDSSEKYAEITPSLDLVPQGLEAVGFGEEIAVESVQVNRTIAYLLQNVEEAHGVKLTGVYLEAQQEVERVDYCVTLLYKGHKWVLSGAGKLIFDGEAQQLTYQVNTLKLGRLSLPADRALAWLFSKWQPSDRIKAEGNILQINADVLPLQITSMRVVDSKFYFTAADAVGLLFEQVFGNGAEDSAAASATRDILKKIAEKIDNNISPEEKEKLESLEKTIVGEILSAQGEDNGEKAQSEILKGIVQSIDGAVEEWKGQLPDEIKKQAESLWNTLFSGQ